MKQRVPSAIYNKASREQAVKQVPKEGLSPKEAAWRLSMPVPTLEYQFKGREVSPGGYYAQLGRPPSKQARLEYLSPVAFERQFYENRLAV